MMHCPNIYVYSCIFNSGLINSLLSTTNLHWQPRPPPITQQCFCRKICWDICGVYLLDCTAGRRRVTGHGPQPVDGVDNKVFLQGEVCQADTL